MDEEYTGFLRQPHFLDATALVLLYWTVLVVSWMYVWSIVDMLTRG